MGSERGSQADGCVRPPRSLPAASRRVPQINLVNCPGKRRLNAPRPQSESSERRARAQERDGGKGLRSFSRENKKPFNVAVCGGD